MFPSLETNPSAPQLGDLLGNVLVAVARRAAAVVGSVSGGDQGRRHRADPGLRLFDARGKRATAGDERQD